MEYHDLSKFKFQTFPVFYDYTSQKPAGLTDYYRSINIQWKGFSSSFKLEILGTTHEHDGFAVPIASSALLLGSGIFGLLTIASRRRKVKE